MGRRSRSHSVPLSAVHDLSRFPSSPWIATMLNYPLWVIFFTAMKCGQQTLRPDSLQVGAHVRQIRCWPANCQSRVEEYLRHVEVLTRPPFNCRNTNWIWACVGRATFISFVSRARSITEIRRLEQIRQEVNPNITCRCWKRSNALFHSTNVIIWAKKPFGENA